MVCPDKLASVGVQPRESSTPPSSFRVKRCRKCMLPLTFRTPSGGQTWCCGSCIRGCQHQRKILWYGTLAVSRTQHTSPPTQQLHLQRHISTAQRRRAGVVLRRLRPSVPFCGKIDTAVDTASNAAQGLRARRSHSHGRTVVSRKKQASES
jgi:hypothetical protein